MAFNGYNGTILWKRDLTPGFIRNTFIATPKVLYVGDDKSCKRIDTATGALKGEIVVDAQVAGGAAWKWAGMGMKDGVLYAIVGPSEKEVKTEIGNRMGYAWPGHRGWGTLYDGESHTLFAIEPESGKVLRNGNPRGISIPSNPIPLSLSKRASSFSPNPELQIRG